MAPVFARTLHRRAQLTVVGNILVISLVILAVCGIFCGVIFLVVLRKQRKTKKAHRALQEERAPFVAPQNMPQHNASFSNQNQYDGPLELQGDMRPIGPAPVQQIDGYAATVCSKIWEAKWCRE